MKKHAAKKDEKACVKPSCELVSSLFVKQKLEQLIEHSRFQSKQVALILVDLDNFNKINHTAVDYAAEHILEAVALRLRQIIQTDEVLVTLGSDEYVLLLCRELTKAVVAKLLKKILKSVSRPYRIADYHYYISCSVGAALFPDHSQSGAGLFRHANIALNRAKELGGENYQFASFIDTKLDIEQILQESIQQKSFMIVYQPIFDLATNKISHLEALLRCPHTQGILLYPNEFLPYAEKSNLMLPIGRIVIDKVLSCIKMLRDHGCMTDHVAINFSASQLHPKLVNFLSRKLKQYGIPGHQVSIEITENSFIHLNDMTKHILEQIRSMNVKICLDDFGMKYSSLNYLKLIELDQIKIDQSFVAGLPDNIYSLAIISGMLTMGEMLNLPMVAEGIETQGQLDFLIDRKCRYGQGYYLSYPLSQDALLGLLKTNHKV